MMVSHPDAGEKNKAPTLSDDRVGACWVFAAFDLSISRKSGAGRGFS